ncbi:hypothetical protein G6011_01713 [Alternaria panax]|uniref:Uncharacterized protein n=1 Tax=Alternaria panax TaxID=48097 RepID=A0AAD4IL48_9PLEO|nr:hypothetical protein G6011_01713 [Alternaria panax]
MTFDIRSLQSLEKLLATATNLIGYPSSEEALGEKAISASRRTSPEARSIAIEINLATLKKKDDNDEILYFLKNELHGRQARLRRHKLSDEQSRLLIQFAELLDEFDYLCSPDNPDVPDDKVFQRKRGLLTTERDDLIKQIQYEITKPNDASHTASSSASSSKSLQVQVQDTPVKQEEHTTMKQDGLTPGGQEELACLSESNLDAIRDFRSYTGADLEHAKKVLGFFDYDLKEAVEWQFEDRKASKTTDSEMDVDLELVDLELEEAIRSSLGQGPTGSDCSLTADNSTTNGKPKGHAQLRRQDAFTTTKGEEQSTDDASRRGRSHAGQPILLDAQGNFKSHVHSEPPPESLWEQYRVMQKRLHAQYYGSSAWFNNPHPLQGVPTRERAKHVEPAKQTQDDEDEKMDSTVDISDSGGYRDVEQEKAAREYREKHEAQEAERIANAADAAMAIELTAQERKAQEKADHEYAKSLEAQFNAHNEAAQIADIAGSWEPCEWAQGTPTTAFSKMEENASEQDTQDDDGSTCGNYGLAHSEHDSVIGNDEVPSNTDLDYIMEQAEENNRENARQENIEPDSFVNPQDLEKIRGYADEQGQDAEKEKYDSPMVFKPDGDVDMDAEDENVQILKVD